ncbi:hypothetical protein [Marivirga lumbricoides]|uniref:hypothetical protein n=1 Tax=Marivirga lumbricoides TaxID=1046115 RepID=UPI00166523BF
MIYNILKIDYTLSRWFSKTNDKIVPGTAFLFLNKVSFVWGMILFILSTPVGLNNNITLFVGIAVLGAFMIMYGLQKPMERYIERKHFHLYYKNLPRRNKVLHRLIGLLSLFVSFGLMLLVGILSLKG